MSTTPATQATPNDDRDVRLLAVGQQCSHPSCLLVDFLPFKCQHCTKAFCQEHFKVDDHKCDQYDETKHNRVAPNCPLCNTPVAIRPGQDPNDRMESHFMTECTVMTGKAKAKTTPVCSRANCKKVLFSPITCDKCKFQFCPAHRFPSDHKCISNTASPSAKPSPSTMSNSLSGINLTTLGAKATALKKSVSSTPTPATAARQVPTPKTASSPSSSNPFANMKADRRAKAERESRKRAMEARARKGLLSEEEKTILEAELKEKDEKKDCVVM